MVVIKPVVRIAKDVLGWQEQFSGFFIKVCSGRMPVYRSIGGDVQEVNVNIVFPAKLHHLLQVGLRVSIVKE